MIKISRKDLFAFAEFLLRSPKGPSDSQLSLEDEYAKFHASKGSTAADQPDKGDIRFSTRVGIKPGFDMSKLHLDNPNKRKR